MNFNSIKFHFVFHTFFLLTHVNTGDTKIYCYECDGFGERTRNKTCTSFNKSELYEVLCENSTFCVKTTKELELSNGEIIGIESRGCAKQQETYQEYNKIDRTWLWKNRIVLSAYKDGCNINNNSKIITKIENCYCSTNFCNGSVRLRNSFFHTSIIFSIHFFKVATIIWNIIKSI